MGWTRWYPPSEWALKIASGRRAVHNDRDARAAERWDWPAEDDSGPVPEKIALGRSMCTRDLFHAAVIVDDAIYVLFAYGVRELREEGLWVLAQETVAFVRAKVEALGPRVVVLGGHSSGGVAAHAVALASGTFDAAQHILIKSGVGKLPSRYVQSPPGWHVMDILLFWQANSQVSSQVLVEALQRPETLHEVADLRADPFSWQVFMDQLEVGSEPCALAEGDKQWLTVRFNFNEHLLQSLSTTVNSSTWSGLGRGRGDAKAAFMNLLDLPGAVVPLAWVPATKGQTTVACAFEPEWPHDQLHPSQFYDRSGVRKKVSHIKQLRAFSDSEPAAQRMRQT